MLSEITILCRPTKDPELQTTKNGTTYVRLDLAVNKGFGDNEHVNYYTGWFKNDEAHRIIRAGVKKGSYLHVSGDLDVKTFTKQDGTPGFSLNITVYNWGYASFGKTKTDENAQTEGQGATGATQNGAP